MSESTQIKGSNRTNTFKRDNLFQTSMKVLLYYQFTDISNPVELTEEMRVFCTKHNLKGRILISKDGINGTVGGEDSDCEAYKVWMHNQPAFKDCWFKEHSVTENLFPRLQIRHRKELVTLRVPVHPKDGGATHIDPEDLNKLVKEHGEDVVFFDARNEIESRIGRFKNAICPNIETFRDVPKAIDDNKQNLKGKKIVMYCTGGIRCETASVLMKEAIPDAEVFQVNGGIYNYCQQPNNDLWEGTCYVFDDRSQVGWNKQGEVVEAQDLDDDMIISTCEYCGCKTSRLVNDERYLERVARVCCEECDTKQDISRMRTKAERQEIFQQQKKNA